MIGSLGKAAVEFAARTKNTLLLETLCAHGLEVPKHLKNLRSTEGGHIMEGESKKDGEEAAYMVRACVHRA